MSRSLAAQVLICTALHCALHCTLHCPLHCSRHCAALHSALCTLWAPETLPRPYIFSRHTVNLKQLVGLQLEKFLLSIEYSSMRQKVGGFTLHSTVHFTAPCTVLRTTDQPDPTCGPRHTESSWQAGGGGTAQQLNGGANCCTVLSPITMKNYMQ